jgi:4a-hydroxytetrahydrobiopterin dehydratase
VNKLSTQDVLEAGLDDWRKLAQALHARYQIGGFAVGAAFAAAVAQAAEAADHHPDLTITRGAVDVSLCTRQDGWWVTQNDIDLAHTISQIARQHGLTPEPAAVTQLEIALDTADQDRVARFWSVLLTGSPDNTIDDSVFDPTGRVPALWFQGTGEHRVPRQRWHFDLWLAPEAAAERITTALAAGGSIADDSQAPSFTVLADPDGNKVCVCTCLERD